MLERIKYLSVGLPEDIGRRVAAGDFDKALELIEARLQQELPAAVRTRLELERELIPVLLGEYPHPFPQALELLQDQIRDFTEAEFRRMIDDGLFDWIWVNGEMHFIRTFHENLLKIRHPIADRLRTPEDPAVHEARQILLNESMRRMKEMGGSAYRFRVRTSLQIREEAVKIGERVTVHLPVPNSGIQVRRVRILRTTPEEAVLAPFSHESRTVCFQGPLERNQMFSVEYTYETHMRYNRPDPAAVSAQQPDFCTGELEPHIVFTPLIRSLYQEIVGGETNPLIKAKKIYDFITERVRYAYVRKYIAILNIPEYAAVNLKGDCGIQALLFITLCRCGGIPARWQSGLFVTPSDIGGHDWAQFYVAPYGWLFADLSFGGSAHRLGNPERREFYFGNLDPFRMPANSAFQCEFLPAKRFTRYDPYDNQYGECETERQGLKKSEYDTEHKVLAIEPIRWEE